MKNNTEVTKFTIAIQARSGSTRLPGKIDRIIDGQSVLRHVLDSCFNSSIYLNRLTYSKNLKVNVVICAPVGDPLVNSYRQEADIIEGPENDVLTRYVMAANKCDSDYIVRITSDCPLIPPALISKHITVAFMNSYDYVSNVDSMCRTSPDGYDCEVISKALLMDTHKNATEKSDREHVTTWIRRERPKWAKMALIINDLDRSNEKISLDTEQDEEKIKEEFEKKRSKIKKAEEIYGKRNIHTFS